MEINNFGVKENERQSYTLQCLLIIPSPKREAICSKYDLSIKNILSNWWGTFCVVNTSFKSHLIKANSQHSWTNSDTDSQGSSSNLQEEIHFCTLTTFLNSENAHFSDFSILTLDCLLHFCTRFCWRRVGGVIVSIREAGLPHYARVQLGRLCIELILSLPGRNCLIFLLCPSLNP